MLLLQKAASVKGFLVWEKAPTRPSVWELPSLPPSSRAGPGSCACSVLGESWPHDDPEVSARPRQGCERRRRPPHTPHPGPRCLDGQETLSTPTCPGSRRPPTTAVPSVSRLVRAGVGPHPGTGRQRLLPERSWGHSPLAAPHPPLQGSDLNRHRSQRARATWGLQTTGQAGDSPHGHVQAHRAPAPSGPWPGLPSCPPGRGHGGRWWRPPKDAGWSAAGPPPPLKGRCHVIPHGQ